MVDELPCFLAFSRRISEIVPGKKTGFNGGRQFKLTKGQVELNAVGIRVQNGHVARMGRTDDGGRKEKKDNPYTA